MSEYRNLLRVLFSSWKRTHQLSARIIDQQLRRNNIKRLQGNYRRFQRQLELNYNSKQEIEHGLIRYHHNLAECQYRTILQMNYQLASKSFKLNPYPRREENFELNRQHREKIDFSQFVGQKNIK